jgi:peptidoglycan/xylan/chitin deacetylase (PgdA/CDA1 family)
VSRFQWSILIFLFSAGTVFFLSSGHTRTVLLAAMLLAYLILFSLGVAVLRFSFFCPVICSGKKGRLQVALTFDDGPDPEATPAVLLVLARHAIKAAFFCIGQKVAQHPDITRRIVAEGHIVANHTDHHFWWTNFLRGAGLGREIIEAQKAIQETTGKIPALFRPPVGLTNPHLAKVLSVNGLTCIGWDVRPLDTMRTKDDVVNIIAGKVRDGSIILLHDAHKSPQEATSLLEKVLEVLKNKGYTVSPLEELLELEAYQDEGTAKEAMADRGLFSLLVLRLAQTRFMRNALEDKVGLDAIKKRPSIRFLSGLTLMGISYIIGWPAVAFFTFLAAYLRKPGILVLGPAIYLLSHLLFFAGMALAGQDGINYGRIILRWTMQRFALAVTSRISPLQRNGTDS